MYFYACMHYSEIELSYRPMDCSFMSLKCLFIEHITFMDTFYFYRKNNNSIANIDAHAWMYI